VNYGGVWCAEHPFFVTISSMEYLSELNTAQREAVTTTAGPVLVIAGAGSGKTRVIEYRVLHLVRQGVDPSSILLLTFTRRAAGEMLERAASHDPRCRGVDGGTFHSIAFRALRKYYDHVSLPRNFTVIDEGDAQDVVHRCVASAGLFEHASRPPKKNTLRRVLSGVRNKGISVEAVLEREYPHLVEFVPQFERLGELYDGYKREKGYCDYDDLLMYLRTLLQDASVARVFGERYRYVMVDEYQDTNTAQGDIVHLLGRAHGNVMAVGDDAQSIYGFRGASHQNIMEFPRRFPQARLISLEENYRSTQPILDVANAVLSSMEEKYEKRLISFGGGGGGAPRLVLFSTPYQEAAWIGEQVADLSRLGVPIRDQAVLFRSAYVSIPVQAELAKRGIAFRVFGGQRFYESAHVKDVVAHLRVIANPRDELSWQRLLLLLPGVGLKTSDRVFSLITASSVHSGLQSYPALQQLFGALGSGSVHEQFGCVVSYYTPLLKEQHDNWRDRLRDLEVVGEMAREYDSLDRFLGDLAIDPVERTRSEGEMLTLSTIHSAKGLEWGAVYFVGLSEGVLPSRFACDHPDELEEELRLFYVGVTRAKKQLFLLNSGEHLSRFVQAPGFISLLSHDLGSSGGSGGRLVDYDDLTYGGGLEVW
jgi:DNA helicase II / ATP-dependent DNA helicase PcrA